MTLDAIADVQARIAAIQSRFEATPATTTGATNTPGADASSASFADMLAALQQGGATGTASQLGGGAYGQLANLESLGLTNPPGTTNSLGTTNPLGRASASNFVATALAEAGKRYVFGATASPSDSNPAAFDCSELVQWAAARNGVALPRTAGQQYATLAAQGDAISVDQALRTPGALLFEFSSPPTVGGAEPSHAHVAISLGDGRTIEARGHAYGVGVFDAGKRFTYAAVVPGLS